MSCVLFLECWDGAYCLRYWQRLAYSAGFYYYVVELVLAYNVVELFHKVHLQRAADAAVLQCHKAVVLLSDYAPFFNQVCIDVHFADVVYDDSELNAFLVGKYVVNQCGFPASEVSGKQ